MISITKSGSRPGIADSVILKKMQYTSIFLSISFRYGAAVYPFLQVMRIKNSTQLVRLNIHYMFTSDGLKSTNLDLI